MTTRYKKLIEVALPLDAINAASAHEKMPGIGAHPRGLHHWWARRPLSTARAVIFSQMVDDPSAHPELFTTEEAQRTERARLFGIIEELVKWENTNNPAVLQRAQNEIWASWRRTCDANNDDQTSEKIFRSNVLPAFHDPFAGGGALPLEAQRLGLEAYASDLNPVAVLINKAMIEIPSKFSGLPPVNPGSRNGSGSLDVEWRGVTDLAEDVLYYSNWIREEAIKRVGHLYPTVKITQEMAKNRPDLRQYVGRNMKVIAWLRARTVCSPNPAFSEIPVPLISSFLLSNKRGNKVWLEPRIEGTSIQFDVQTGDPENLSEVKKGTTSNGARTSFRCLLSGSPITFDYIRDEGKAGRLSDALMAVVIEGDRERLYLAPTDIPSDPSVQSIPSDDVLNVELPAKALGFRVQQYGMGRWQDLFTDRQRETLTVLSDLVRAVRSRIINDIESLDGGGSSYTRRRYESYAEAVGTYLAFAVDRCSDFSNTLTRWVPGNQKVMNVFSKQTLAMTWDFPEANLLEDVVGGFGPAAKYISQCIRTLPASGRGIGSQADAGSQEISVNKVISADPPYFDNIGYADLSDFFYLWLRRSVRDIYPELCATVTVPKTEEMIASPFRHDSTEAAESFFISRMSSALSTLANNAHPSFPITIYYAFKQSEQKSGVGRVSTGWATFLEAVIDSGLTITGTWPVRTEQSHRQISSGTNALASSIVIVCRPADESAPVATRSEFLSALRSELGEKIRVLQSGNIAPVDLPQSSIGPGMDIFTRYSRVLESDGTKMTVEDALASINAVLEEVLAEQEGEYDPATRWAISWFEQHGMRKGSFGDADNLARARNTAVDGLAQANIVDSGGGEVRLLRMSEISGEWSVLKDERITVWHAAHRVIRAHDIGGIDDAGRLVSKLGYELSNKCRDLAYRLYSICEHKRWTEDAISYNGLVAAWPEILRSADSQTVEQQGALI